MQYEMNDWMRYVPDDPVPVCALTSAQQERIRTPFRVRSFLRRARWILPTLNTFVWTGNIGHIY